MSIEVWLTFIFTATVILVIPGPTIIFVVGQSLNHGRKASLPLALGVISGDAMCIALSLIGLSAVLSIWSIAFTIIKYIGAFYLVYLGLKMIFTSSKLNVNQHPVSSFNPKTIFRDVFLVNALNPKGIIFYSAFMPQFVNPEHNIFVQFGLLATTFLALALINVIGYSLLASRTSEVFRSERFIKSFNITGGLALIGAGLYSATVEKS